MYFKNETIFQLLETVHIPIHISEKCVYRLDDVVIFTVIKLNKSKYFSQTNNKNIQISPISEVASCRFAFSTLKFNPKFQKLIVEFA